MKSQVMKTTGVTQNDGRKHYVIIWDSEIFIAKPDGQKFVCNGVRDTLKNIQAGIKQGDIINNDTVDAVNDPCVPVATSTVQPTWDCIDPCALIIADGNEINSSDIHNTLSCRGWLLEDGITPDVAKARREIDRYRNRKTPETQPVEIIE